MRSGGVGGGGTVGGEGAAGRDVVECGGGSMGGG